MHARSALGLSVAAGREATAEGGKRERERAGRGREGERAGRGPTWVANSLRRFSICIVAQNSKGNEGTLRMQERLRSLMLTVGAVI